MALNKIVSKIFGEHIFDERKPVSSIAQRETESSLTDQIIQVKAWIQRKLKEVDEKCKELVVPQNTLMRLGPQKVVFDVDINTTIRISLDRLTIRSQGSFNTIKANVCVIGGKWMYEVQLHSKGVMQIGWCSRECTFSENSGVGDTLYSYAFDGSKQQKWHMSTVKYGDLWQTGDIIGICLNLEKNMIEYYRNGISLGIAFENVEKGPGISYFPAISLGYSEGLKANFGNTPLRFPIPGYNSLQAKPMEKMEKTDFMLRYVLHLASILSRPKYRLKDKRFKEKRLSTKKTVYTLLTSILIERSIEFLVDPYVIEEILIPNIMNLCITVGTEEDKDILIVPGSTNSTLGTMLTLFWNFLEPDEIKFVLKKLLNTLLGKYTQSLEGIENESQRKVIIALNCICSHPKTRKFYLENKFFKKHCLSHLMYVQPFEYKVLTDILPDEIVWTAGLGGSKDKYLLASEVLSKTVLELYTLQKQLLRKLLTSNDGDSSSPSSRRLFATKLRKYVVDAGLEQRPLQSFLVQSSINYPIEPPVALSFLCVLTDVIQQFLEEELSSKSASIKPKFFFDGTLQYQHFDRVGGVLSHLYKVHRNYMIQELGTERFAVLSLQEHNSLRREEADASIIFTPSNLNNVSIVGRNQTNASSTFLQLQYYRQQLENTTSCSADAIQILYEFLDIITIYYYTVGHKYIVKMSAVRDELANLNNALVETKIYQEDTEKIIKDLANNSENNVSLVCRSIITDLCTKLVQRRQILEKRSIELARKQAWYRSIALGKQRRKHLQWLLNSTLNTLKESSQMGPLFAFVPEVYINVLPILLDTILDLSFHDLCYQFELSDAAEEISIAAAFLGEHSADPRIVLASCKDSLLQALGTLICHEAGVRALENAPKKSQQALIQALLRPYENRAWGQSNWLLLRCWLGDGFAYRNSYQPSIWQGGNDLQTLGICRNRAKTETHTGLLYHIAPAYSSKYFQELIGMRLISNEPYATAFLNSVLSQINWAFSEFILLLQEIQNTAYRQENTMFDSKQLKICCMCFELTVSLMRCLEMVISVAPDIVQDSSRANSDLILNRICQLISQVLSRVTVPPGCFQFVVDMCSSDLHSMTHFAIITAALGILLALMKNEICSNENPEKVTRISRSLLTDSSFQIANLEFALGEVKSPILQQEEIPRGNFNPQTRGYIDPLTNDVRMPYPSTSKKRIRSDPPIIKFSLYDYPTHVSREEIEKVRELIDVLRNKQSLLSEITLPSEDSLCPICCAKPIAATFHPCKHQSCSNCILQHLMNSKLCFYCKTLIRDIESADGKIIYGPVSYVPE